MKYFHTVKFQWRNSCESLLLIQRILYTSVFFSPLKNVLLSVLIITTLFWCFGSVMAICEFSCRVLQIWSVWCRNTWYFFFFQWGKRDDKTSTNTNIILSGAVVCKQNRETLQSAEFLRTQSRVYLPRESVSCLYRKQCRQALKCQTKGRDRATQCLTTCRKSPLWLCR